MHCWEEEKEENAHIPTEVVPICQSMGIVLETKEFSHILFI